MKDLVIYTENESDSVEIEAFDEVSVQLAKDYAEEKGLSFIISQQEWCKDNTLYSFDEEKIVELTRSHVKFTDGLSSVYLGSYLVEDEEYLTLFDIYSSPKRLAL